MTRKDFIKQSAALGIGLPFLSILLESCGSEMIEPIQFDKNFSGKVLIIGAGAAGLTAAYWLQRQNIEFQVLEASSDFGGRVKRADHLADFPIDIGAEWIHTEPSILAQIINDASVDADIEFVNYNPQSIRIWNGQKLKKIDFGSNFYSEYKFKRTTWYGFFERFILPSIQDKILLDSPVEQIDYSGSTVKVRTKGNESYEADRVIITVPIKILQGESIEFTPALPSAKKGAIDSVHMGDGLKIFVEFKEKFYPDLVLFGRLVSTLLAAGSTEKTVYDAAFRKGANRHVLGLFTAGEDATNYTSLGSNEKIFETFMAELDEVFDGKASKHYVQHLVQNWSSEPYVQGSYSLWFDGSRRKVMEALREPVNGKLYFAGEATSFENQATVHGASETGLAAVEFLLKNG